MLKADNFSVDLFAKANRFLLLPRFPVTKSELIDAIAVRQTHLGFTDVEMAVKSVLDHLSDTLERGERVEIRGFGSFSVIFRPARVGRNPKTGETVALPGKSVPHFKPGKELRDRANGTVSASPVRARKAAAGSSTPSPNVKAR
jgi:integration host factor subunit beta